MVAFVFVFGCSSMSDNFRVGVSIVVDQVRGMTPVRYYSTATLDNWTLHLVRINGSTGKDDRLPVVLCHGFGHNGYLWRLGGQRSLAQYLAANGYDVWIANLRGSGASSKPGFIAVRTLVKTPPGYLIKRVPQIMVDFDKVDWTVDDHIAYDIPAIAGLIRSVTKKPSVNWIGHSMGAMIALAYAEEQKSQHPDINSIAAIGAPMLIPFPLNDALTIIRENPKLFQALNLFLNQSIPSLLNAATGGNLQNGLDYLYYNRANMNRLTIVEMLYYVIEDMSPGCVAQFQTMIETGRFLSTDGKIDYTKRLDRIRVPVLSIAGKADNIAEPEAMRHLYRQIASKDKMFKLIGISSGAAHDYGHTDLILGYRSHDEVFPILLKWLNDHKVTKKAKSRPTSTRRSPGSRRNNILP